MDFMQQIFDSGTDEEAVWERLGVQRRRLHLLTLLRCSPFIVATAAPLIDDSALRDAFLRQAHTQARGGDKTLLYYASVWQDERRRLIDAIRSKQGEKIAVLLPMNRQVHGFAQGLRDAGLDVDTPGGPFDNNPLDFSNSRPKLLNYHQAKGLTFDSVFMPRLVNGSFRQMSEERISRLLFVGITRATKWVYLSTTTDGSALPVLSRLLPLGKAGVLTVQRGPDLFSQARAAGTKPKPTDDRDDISDIL
jgi:superfamily I DNA/RNA helicase